MERCFDGKVDVSFHVTGLRCEMDFVRRVAEVYGLVAGIPDCHRVLFVVALVNLCLKLLLCPCTVPMNDGNW